MKKLLLTLTLLLTLGLAAKAQTITDELTSSNFTGMAYATAINYTAPSNAEYLAQAYSNGGFQMRTNKNGTGVKVVTPVAEYIIESIELTFKTIGGGVNIYASDTEIDLKSLPSSATSQTSTNGTFVIGKPYFAITATSNDVCVVSNIKVNWVSSSAPAECPVPEFSVADGAEVYPGQTISVDGKGATSVKLSVDGTDVAGTEYTIPDNATIGSTITLTAKSTLEGENVTKPDNSATVTVKVVKKPIWVLVTDAATLSAGDRLIFVNMASNKAMSTEDNKNNRKTVDVSISNGNLSYDPSATHQPLIVELGGEAGKWTFHTTNYEGTNGYFASATSNNNNYLLVQNDAMTSTISITGNNAKVIFDTQSSRNTIMYNNGLFACYASGQDEVQIFREEKPAEIVGFHSDGIQHKATVASLDYTLSVANHKEGNVYIVTLTVTDGEGISVSEKNEIHTPVADEPVAAMARTAAVTKHSGFIKLTGLKNSTAYTAKVSYAVKGEEAAAKTDELPGFTTNATGIEDVTIDGNEAAEYYNLQGVRVAEPQAGQIYIVRRGAKVTKELIK